ncbi:MAG: O-antigen ligase domain-containing protein [Mesorhizobium sp.]|nr:MAG: O-antigen ligase domain-containing protein [Mesorhizobium sp.]
MHASIQKRLVEIVLLWTLVGYPLMGMYTTVTGVNNNTVSIIFRAFIVLICLFLIWKAFADKKFKTNKLILVFLLLYFIRLIYDYAYQFNDYALVAVQFYLSSVVIPVIALGSYSEYILSIQKKVVFLISFSGAVFLPAFFYAYRNGLFYTQGTDEFNVRYASEFVNAVLLGHFTCTVVIAAFFYMIEYRPRLIECAVHVAILGGSVVALFLSGSRAAFVGVVVGSAVYAISRPSRLVVLLPLVLGSLLYLPQDNFLVRRMGDLVSAQWDTGALQRMEVQSTAIGDFLNSPIIGKHFLDMNWGPGSYPHNIIIEILMALGLVGAVPLLLIFCMSIYRAMKFRSELTFYTIIYLVSLTFQQTSGTIWAADNVFVLASILLTANKNFEPRLLARLPRRANAAQRSIRAGMRQADAQH